MTAAGVPQPVVDGFTQASSSGSFDFSSLTGVGDHGRRDPGGHPGRSSRRAVQPFIGAMVDGHPRRVQPRDGPDLLARRGRLRSSPPSPPLAIKEIPLRTSNEAPVPTAGRCRAAAGPAATPDGVSREHRDRRLTLAPPLAPTTPAAPPAGSFAVPPLRWPGMTAAPAPFPPRSRRPARTDGAVRAGPRPRRPAARVDAARQPRRPRRPARPHAGGDRRDRRPLPAHERAAVDRRARRLRRGLSAPRGPVRPALAATRSRCRRPAASTLTGSTTRRGRRPVASRRWTRPARRPRRAA